MPWKSITTEEIFCLKELVYIVVDSEESNRLLYMIFIDSERNVFCEKLYGGN